MTETPLAIRILIADDHVLFREGLRRLLESEKGFEVVGEAGSVEDTSRLANILRPDLLLLDLAMPRGSGLEVLRELTRAPSPARTVVLTAMIEPDQVVEALQLGARGVLLKESAAPMLFKCIHCVMEGQYWLGRTSVADLVTVLQSLMSAARRERPRKAFGLTARELEVVTAVVTGRMNKDVAQQFSISEETVKRHLTNIFDKLGVSNRLELALFALRHQLVGNL